MVDITETTLEEKVQRVVSALDNDHAEAAVEVDGHRVELTHLDKPLWVRHEGETIALWDKRAMIRYYALISPWLLPHLHDRPITLKRYPDGIDQPAFMQRHFDEVPDFVETVEIFSESSNENGQFLLCQNLASLLWFANLDTIEFHPWYSRINPEKTGLPTIFINSTATVDMSVLGYPDFLVFDLDPSLPQSEQEAIVSPAAAFEPEDESMRLERQAFDQARQAAACLHKLLEKLQLTSFVKLSGKTGIHVLVPLVRQYRYTQVREAAKRIGQQLTEEYPDLFTMEWQMGKRHGKVFFDANQNARGKSLASAFSLRPTLQATASIPVSWQRLDTVSPADTTLASLTATLQQSSSFTDPWQDILRYAQELPDELIPGGGR